MVSGRLVAVVLGVALVGCGGNGGGGDTARAVGTVLDQRTLSVGGEAQLVTLGQGRERVEVEFPAMTLPRRALVTVRLEVDIPPRRGQAPVTGMALHVATANLVFATPARMRQPVSPPPAGRMYVAVQTMPDGESWDERGAARAAGAAADEGQLHEVDVTGSGLWGIAVAGEQAGGAGGRDGGAGGAGGGAGGGGGDAGPRGDAPDGGVPPGGDGGAGQTGAQPPQLAMMNPVVGPVGVPVQLTLTGSNLSAEALVYFAGQKMPTTRLSSTSLRADVPGTATAQSGQYPVWIENGTDVAAQRSNLLYFTVTTVAGAPLILDYTPDNGLPGDRVLIVGRDLMGEQLKIVDALGVTGTPGPSGSVSWIGGTSETLELVIPDGWHTGPITVSHVRGSYQGKIFNVGRNLASSPGATAFASSEYGGTWTIPRGADNNLVTSWFSRVGDCASLMTCTSIPWFRVDFAAPQTVARIALRGNREYMSGYDFLRGKFEVLGAGGAVLWSASYDLPEPDRDLDLVLPSPIEGTTSVRFTSERDESNEPGFADFEIFGP